MYYRFTKNYGARAMGEIIDVRPEAAEELVKAGVLVQIGASPNVPQDRSMQAPPRGRRATE